MPTKAIRFKDEELEAINTFLKQNPFFDFSTLAKIAIAKFIKNPELQLEPVKKVLDLSDDKEMQ
jgi:hypothetical protein